MFKRILWSLVACVALALPALAAGSSYQLTQKYTLGGDGGWDYLTYDGVGKRLYISRGTHVMVVDPSKGTVVGDVPGTAGVHGIAVAPELGKGFTSNGRDNSVTVFDLKTLQPITTVKIPGRNPDAIIYDPASKRVYTFVAGPQAIVAIDAVTNGLLGSMPIGGKPEFATVDGRGTLFLNLEDTSQIIAGDTMQSQIKGTWALKPCEEPSGMAIDARSHRIFIGCSNKMMAVVNSDNGAVVTTVPIGAGSDAMGFDPGTNLVFSSNGGDGTLTVVHEDTPDKYTVVGNPATQAGARTMAVDPGTHNVYLVTAQFNVAPTPVPSGQPRRTMVPGSFTLLVMSPTK
jgi:DNA-binding beta-propeller fold protein YncE